MTTGSGMTSYYKTWRGRILLWFLDRATLHTIEPCNAYGGTFSDGTPRVCEKPRWHWDSHTYDRQETVGAAAKQWAYKRAAEGHRW